MLLKIPETYSIVRRLEGSLVVLVGIHQEGPEGLTQCVMCATTQRRFDVSWEPFWLGVNNGTIPEANEMETLAAWAALGNAPHDISCVALGIEEHG